MSGMAHHYNLDGRCPVMDGFDLLATTPTGSGKVGYLILLMLVVREIAADMTLAIAKEILPRDPVTAYYAKYSGQDTVITTYCGQRSFGCGYNENMPVGNRWEIDSFFC